MSPSEFLGLAVAVTVMASLSERLLGRMHRRRLTRLAAELGMNYSPHDQFRLTPRVARHFPVPGAAKILVVDLIYGMDQDVYRYIFTAAYTAGIITGKHRVLRVASFTEPRGRGGEMPNAPIVLAPADLPLLEQYRKLIPANLPQEPNRIQYPS